MGTQMHVSQREQVRSKQSLLGCWVCVSLLFSSARIEWDLRHLFTVPEQSQVWAFHQWRAQEFHFSNQIIVMTVKHLASICLYVHVCVYVLVLFLSSTDKSVQVWYHTLWFELTTGSFGFRLKCGRCQFLFMWTPTDPLQLAETHL